MARTDNLTNFLTDIAESIRTKEGTEEQILASEFDTRIANLPSGGSIPEKGIVINEWNSNGYATDISVVGMTQIPDYYFYQSFSFKDTYGSFMSYKLENLRLPDNITKLGNYVFYQGKHLKLDKLPSDLTNIGDHCFEGCSNISLDKLPKGLTNLGRDSFSECQNIKISEIPEGVTKLGQNTFYYCTNLSNLTFKGDVTKIGYGVFQRCENLKTLIFPNITDVPTLDSKDAFSYTPIADGDGYVYIPNSLVEKAKSSTNWSTYATQIRGINLERINISETVINTYNNNKTKNITVTYNDGQESLYKPEQEGYTLSVSGNATIDGNVLTLTDDAQVGDIITVTVTSTYDTSISSTQEIEVVYVEQLISVNPNNGQWVDSGTTTDTGSVIYKSDAGSYNIDNGKSTAILTVTGYTSVKLYIRSYAESSYDYTEAFAVDTTATRAKGLFSTKNNNSATKYVECVYELDGGTHTIEIMYSKDSSGNSNDDRGYFYIGEVS